MSHCCIKGDECALYTGSLESGLGAHITGGRSWEINETVEEIDTTDFQSGDCRENITCFKDWTVSLEALVDSVYCPDDANLYPGGQVQATFFLCNGGWYSGTFRVISRKDGGAVGDAQAFSIEGHGTGCLDRTNICPTP
jgi:predicted secreted protein